MKLKINKIEGVEIDIPWILIIGLIIVVVCLYKGDLSTLMTFVKTVKGLM